VKLSILSPERRLLEGVEVEEVTLPGSEGQIQILPGHATIVGTLETGGFHYRAKAGQQARGFLATGFFEVKGGDVSVMAETLELQGEISVDRAKKAQKAAEDALRDAELEPSKFKKYQLKLQRALVRQQIASHGG
jgi:F-type H+-transporting ATPase subunit epsilon